MASAIRRAIAALSMVSQSLAAAPALAHGLDGSDAAFVAAVEGPRVVPFLYLGAKHMVTGYDHLLFILGVIFFLHRMRHVALYVTLFSIGHSITLLAGVQSNVRVDPHLVDAIIGLSVAFKAFDNLGGFKTILGIQPDAKAAVLIFGLVHGFGLATKLQALNPSRAGLIANMIAFNIGVEVGQLLALSVMLTLMVWWRARPGFARDAVYANTLILAAGALLMIQQLAGYLLQRGT